MLRDDGDDAVHVVDASTDVVFRADPSGVIVAVSPSVTAVLGWDPADLVGQPSTQFLHPDDALLAPEVREAVTDESGAPIRPLRFVTASGGYRRMVGRGQAVHNDAGALVGRIYALRDVQDTSARDRALTTLSRGNGVLVRATDEPSLLQRMCETVVEAGGYELCWYGRAEHDEARTVRPLASAGQVSYTDGITVTWDESPTGMGPTGVAIRTRTTQLGASLDDASFAPWQQRAQQQGFRCSIALPVIVDGEVDGALMVYAGEINAFDGVAQTLLEDLAADLGYGMHRLHDAARLMEVLTSSVYVLSAAVESRDPYTAGHQSHVGALCQRIGEEMGLDQDRVYGLVLGGAIHDLGKISISRLTLNKQCPLDDDEWAELRQHPEVGYQIVGRFPWPWPIADMIRQHHERLDGSGYPLGLKGEEILLESRIIAVADLYEAMANDRPYRSAPGPEKALSVLHAGAGAVFDADVVAALDRVLDAGWEFPD